MLTETTGPARATDHLTRSVQGLRDACAVPCRSGWRAALGPAVAADALRMAMVALLDALLRLMHDFAGAQGRAGAVPAGLVPSPMGAVRAGLDVPHGGDADRAAPPCKTVSGFKTPHARRASRISMSAPLPSAVPAVAMLPVARLPHRSTAWHRLPAHGVSRYVRARRDRVPFDAYRIKSGFKPTCVRTS